MVSKSVRRVRLRSRKVGGRKRALRSVRVGGRRSRTSGGGNGFVDADFFDAPSMNDMSPIMNAPSRPGPSKPQPFIEDRALTSAYHAIQPAIEDLLEGPIKEKESSSDTPLKMRERERERRETGQQHTHSMQDLHDSAPPHAEWSGGRRTRRRSRRRPRRSSRRRSRTSGGNKGDTAVIKGPEDYSKGVQRAAAREHTPTPLPRDLDALETPQWNTGLNQIGKPMGNDKMRVVPTAAIAPPWKDPVTHWEATPMTFIHTHAHPSTAPGTPPPHELIEGKVGLPFPIVRYGPERETRNRRSVQQFVQSKGVQA